MKVVYCVPAYTDERGSIQDVVENTPFEHATIIKSAAGSRRGDHYHLLTTQYVFVLSGRLRALARMTEDGPVESEILHPGALVINSPGEHHALIAITDSTFLVLTHGPRGGSGYEFDTYRLPTPIPEAGDVE